MSGAGGADPRTCIDSVTFSHTPQIVHPLYDELHLTAQQQPTAPLPKVDDLLPGVPCQELEEVDPVRSSSSVAAVWILIRVAERGQRSKKLL